MFVALFLILLNLIGLGFAETAYCMNMGASSSSIVTQASSHSQFMQLKEEDCRSILFETWQDCDKILKTCQQGRLPSAENGYEFVSQLQPAQINNLVNSISAKLNPSIVSEATMQEWAQISVQFKEANSRLFTSFHKDLIPGLMLISGVSLPLSMSPEEGIELLLKVPFSQ
ncbi:hypothetical protein, partial [Salmonella sp. s24813]|uniref:hypothetical protein n=2 Tax=Enterobacteriaceae TaxID=543 RepID=UPI00397FC1D7